MTALVHVFFIPRYYFCTILFVFSSPFWLFSVVKSWEWDFGKISCEGVTALWAKICKHKIAIYFTNPTIASYRAFTPDHTPLTQHPNNDDSVFKEIVILYFFNVTIITWLVRNLKQPTWPNLIFALSKQTHTRSPKQQINGRRLNWLNLITRPEMKRMNNERKRETEKINLYFFRSLIARRETEILRLECQLSLIDNL